MPLLFNAVDIPGIPESILWHEPSKTAYVITKTPTNASNGDPITIYSVTTVGFGTGAPIVFGTVAFTGTTTTPTTPGNPHPARLQYFGGGVPRNVFDPQRFECVDVAGTIWSAWIQTIQPNGGGVPPSVQVAYMFTSNPGTGTSTQALTSYDGDNLHKPSTRFLPGVYSFMAGGHNYIWSSVSVDGALPASTTNFILIVDTAAPAFSRTGPSLKPKREYSAPIFDGVQYAYLIEAGQDSRNDGVADDGSFSIIQYNVSSGFASINQTFLLANARSIGRAYWGIYNTATGKICLYTTGGAVQIFDPATGSITPAVTGLFSALVFAGGLEFTPGLVQYFYINPGCIANGQQGLADVANCTMMGSSPAISLNALYGTTGPYEFRGVRRLNLATLTILDDRYPQEEWTASTASPSGMNGVQAIHISSLNSLLWITGKKNNDPHPSTGNQLLQLIWPSQGDCVAAPPVVARQPNTFVIS